MSNIKNEIVSSNTQPNAEGNLSENKNKQMLTNNPPQKGAAICRYLQPCAFILNSCRCHCEANTLIARLFFLYGTKSQVKHWWCCFWSPHIPCKIVFRSYNLQRKKYTTYCNRLFWHKNTLLIKWHILHYSDAKYKQRNWKKIICSHGIHVISDIYENSFCKLFVNAEHVQQ